MKPTLWFLIFFFEVLSLAGCGPAAPTMQPTQPESRTTPTLSATHPPTRTPTVIPPTQPPPLTQTPTLVSNLPPELPATLTPEEAARVIRLLLSEAGDCSAPCFWGITPGKTTKDEAEMVFRHFGLEGVNISFEGNDFYDVSFKLDTGRSMSVNLAYQHKMVENLSVHIQPESQKAGIPRAWLAYSPETLIQRYGEPTRVEFAADLGLPVPTYVMIMYFDAVDLIVEYYGENITQPDRRSSQVCPLTAQFETVRVWMGKNPVNPPGKAVALEKATSLTLDVFSALMLGEPDQACFVIDGDTLR